MGSSYSGILRSRKRNTFLINTTMGDLENTVLRESTQTPRAHTMYFIYVNSRSGKTNPWWEAILTMVASVVGDGA